MVRIRRRQLQFGEDVADVLFHGTLGHHQFGIYAEVVTGGEIALNDEIRP